VCYVSLEPPVQINSGLLKGDANIFTGLIPHSAKLGQPLVGEIRHMNQVIWRGFMDEKCED
jgi:hypothetical protein